ncbi:MAG: hypothetical protein KKF48_05960 [Nanoarchaeota archaeon]|nr:hypothetical protein [Nanoarchaeota archaeon]
MTYDELVVTKHTIDDIFEAIGIAKAEGGPMFPYEGAALRKLLQEWAKATKKAVASIDEFMTRVEWQDLNAEELRQLFASLETELGVGFGAAVQADISSLLDKSYRKGKSAILKPKGLPLNFLAIDTDAIAWLQEHHIYWIRNFYSRRLSQGIADIVAEGMAQGLGRVDIGKMLKEAFDGYKGLGVQPEAYWRGLAANGMNRSRNFGQIQGYVDAEIKQIEVVAVLDEKTSSICRELNGKIINVSAAVRQRDALMAATRPEDVEQISPWLSVDEAKGRMRGNVADNVGMPPYHFHCRTTTVERSAA